MKRSILLLGLIFSSVLSFVHVPKAVAIASAVNESPIVQTEILASGYTGTNEDGDRETIKTGK
ncbi:MAG: hypothetical protein ACRDB1_07775 [Microcoleaceae cyanobacterium]